MKIVIVGASGAIGSRIVSEAVNRGHEVIAISRHVENVPANDLIKVVQADAGNVEELVKILKGQDALVSSISPRGNNDAESYLETMKAILKAADQSEINYTLIVGGLSNLFAPTAFVFWKR